MSPAVAFMEEIGTDCVVKPAGGTGGGLGVTTGVRSRWRLARAAFAAGSHAGRVVIEEQVGRKHRLLYLDGKLIDAVIRRPPRVVGDGRSSMAQLVEAVNSQRLRQDQSVSHDLLTVDMDMKHTLANQSLSLRSVPAQGRVVVLKTVINQNSGVNFLEPATPLLCPSVITDGPAGAEPGRRSLRAWTFITADPGRPLGETGGVFLEVNSQPGYFWHYHKRDGEFPLALHVLQCLLADRSEPCLADRASSSCGVGKIE